MCVQRIRIKEQKIVNIDDFKALGSLAILAESDADQFEEESKEKLLKAEELKDDLDFYKKEILRLKRRREISRKAIMTKTVLMAIFGLAVGITVSVAFVFKYHGPTMTMLGTIGAGGIYILVGALCALAFGYTGRMWAVDKVNIYTDRICDYREIEQEIREEIETHRQNAEFLAEKAKKNRYEAWRHRGFLR